MPAGQGPIGPPPWSISGLYFTNAVEPLPGPCGEMLLGWGTWWWLVSPATASGYIIQEVVTTSNIRDCSGNVINLPKPFADWKDYWEAFTVNSGSTTAVSLNPIYGDLFKVSVGPINCSQGTVTRTGNATFCAGLILPLGFTPNRLSPAGDLPMTTQDPGPLLWPQGSTTKTMTISWNCCPNGTVRSSTITHN